jgi:hypothetical protein
MPEPETVWVVMRGCRDKGGYLLTVIRDRPAPVRLFELARQSMLKWDVEKYNDQQVLVTNGVEWIEATREQVDG